MALGKVVDVVKDIDLSKRPQRVTIHGLTDGDTGKETDFSKLSMKDMMTWGGLMAKILPCVDDFPFMFVELPSGVALYQDGSTIGNLKDYVDNQDAKDFAQWELSMTPVEEEKLYYLVTVGAIRAPEGQPELAPGVPCRGGIMWLGLTEPLFV